jgi:predicted HTH transcriptional regulator
MRRVIPYISVNFPESIPANRKYKEQKLNEIIAAICAMLNSNGGKVILYNEFKCKKVKRLSSLVVRILEQSMISIIGLNQTVSNINFKEDKESIVISVKKADSLITTNYNLYLPSQSQVVQVFPWEPLEKVKDDIINREVVQEPVQFGSHCTTFAKGTNSSFQDNKSVQLKHLKAVASKRTTLADRMTGKGNKFSCYVSAFANYNGGHIYYGIRDDGVVEGELISNENDQSEIRKKVEKVINKMTWPEQIGQPTRAEHWEIFFESVKDENSKPIPSTFVIVIYIAACLGGVFTEEPECYEMVEGKVEKISFVTWKKRVLQLDDVDIHAAVQRMELICDRTSLH